MSSSTVVGGGKSLAAEDQMETTFVNIFWERQVKTYKY